MNLAALIPVVLQISVALVVFCVALRARPGDLSYLLRRPSLLFRSVLAMYIVMPMLAAGAAMLFDLRDQVKVALILLAVSPVPPILPGKFGKAGGNLSYGIGLLMISALLGVVTIPISVWLIGQLLGHSVAVPARNIAVVVGMSAVLPLLLGAIVRRVAPVFAERAAKPISAVATIVLVLILIPILIRVWPVIVRQMGDYTLVAIVLFALAGLAVGHFLGGPDHDDRTVLGLAAASRHPGVALAISNAVVVPENRPLISAAVLLALLVGAVVTAPYVKWRNRSASAAKETAPAS